ncbi:MAG: GGDEF domain-containing protein [Myxococcaceae bacterium]|nr:GGDEF domain-containing protein [Myxococcaceae bacterium]
MGQKTVTAVTAISKIQKRPFARSSALVVIYGQELGRKYDLEDGKTIIGRSSKSDIQIDHDSVSRQHVRVTVEDGRVEIEDLGSTNGTFLNDESLAGRVALRTNDLVKVGRTVFKFIAHNNIEAAYHDEIYRLTTVDGLTQVHNRRSFDEVIERELSRCRRYGRTLSLVLIDVDHFKKINDTFGHLAGDAVLKEVASAIKKRIRKEDHLSRYGGEEFAVLTPEIDLKGARAMAEKLRRMIEKHEFSFDDEVIPVTISCGVGTLGKKGDTSAALVQRADEKLYEAKAAGRNQIC